MLPEMSNAQQGYPHHNGVERDTSTSDDNDGGSSPNASSTRQLKCSICQNTFRRPEHLKRHVRSHTKEKPFQCTRCGRHFSRTDTLHRHELNHHASGIEGGSDHTHRITVKTFRACVKCAVARVRCSGGTPCVRCQRRSLECHYPTQRRSKAKAVKDASQRALTSSPSENPPLAGFDGDQWLGLDTEVRHRSPAKEESQPQSHRHQKPQSQFQIIGLDTYDVSRSDLMHQRPPGIPEQNSGDGRTPTSSRSGHSNPDILLPGGMQTANASQLPYPSYSDIDTQQIYQSSPITGVPSTLSSEPLTSISGRITNVPKRATNDLLMDTEIANSRNHQMQMRPTQTLFDESILSTINWLPTDFFPHAMDEVPCTPGFPSQVIHGTWPGNASAQTGWPPPSAGIDQMNSYVTQSISQAPSENILFDSTVRSRGLHAAAIDRVSQSESSQSTVRSGDYYVDGNGARLPKYRRKPGPQSRPLRNCWSFSTKPREDVFNSPFAFPNIGNVDNFSDKPQFRINIDHSTYSNIREAFRQMCQMEDLLFPPFESDTLPSPELLALFVQLYFQSFHPVYPILHQVTFDPNKCHWLLTLAVSAIGCHFADMSGTDKCARAFHEFIRRVIHVYEERSISERTPLWVLQVMLLNCIGLLHSGSERDKQSALSTFNGLVNLANCEKLLLASDKPDYLRDGTEGGAAWALWIEEESRQRTGYCIWLLDCTLVYHFDTRPLMSLDDCQAPLPSPERIWQAKDGESWSKLYESSSRGNESLHSAAQILYIEKRLVSGIGEFGHVLLVHALYQRTREVSDYFLHPLSCWTPTARKQSRDSVIPSDSVWLPGNPAYAKWRNSACDCLDILHWTANGTIAEAAGLEHPTVLHLHAARIVLLVPFREVRTLATSLAQDTMTWSEHYHAIEWNRICRWVKHDQYKARLAIIHAGSVLWYIRRYSTNSFHEPVAAFLAILTLWAYGSCHGQASGDTGPEPRYQPDPSDPSHDPTFIHLDRPCDDELVQLFVREGHKMRGNLTGVGDICGQHGPERILKEGCRTLSGLTSWGISRNFITILTRLADRISCDSYTSSESHETETVIN